jgi:enediyne biosynthesis protein E4
MNTGKGGFTRKSLPSTAQLSPVYGLLVKDVDSDGNLDIILGGNFYESKPEVGIYDASYGTVLKGDGRGGFNEIPSQQTGINIRGAVRDITALKAGGRDLYIIARNNAAPVFYTAKAVTDHQQKKTIIQ